MEKIEWWTGICPPNLPRGTHVELVLKQIFAISEDVQNILIKILNDAFVENSYDKQRKLNTFQSTENRTSIINI